VSARERRYIIRTTGGLRVVVSAPDADVASYRARRRGFAVASVKAAA
jgi:hypothetical protein